MSEETFDGVLTEMENAAQKLEEGSMVVCGQIGASYLRELAERFSNSLDQANPSRLLSGATSCSHGGEHELANAAGSHDSALSDSVACLELIARELDKLWSDMNSCSYTNDELMDKLEDITTEASLSARAIKRRLNLADTSERVSGE